ncbi:hypothetical protein [Rubrivirga sp. IMCC43871]|uniref:hypothetical protein n=1 Tax=Rubrivirga sp. IMCC43871 TaxID=3391575 RepID=UPI00398FEA9D
MATARLADRQIRAAQQAVRGLDVRGPVSQALGKTGIIVPADDALVAAAPEPAPTRKPAPRAYGKAAPRVLKPFAEAPWPTRKPAPAEPEPLTGLTADERRVHRILIDTLDIATEQEPNSFGGLGFADRRKLEALDLAYIDAQLVGDKRRDSTRQTLGAVAVVTLIVAAIVVGVTGSWAGALGLAAGALGLGGPLLFSGRGGATGQRRRILLALRELALLAHADDATSDALAHADALIDRLADADQAPAPLLDLPDRHSDADAPAARQRVRS